MRKSLLVFVSFIYLSSGCAKEESNPSGSSTSTKASVSGLVLDENNQPVAGATVMLENATEITNSQGYFILEEIQLNKERNLITVSKPGYWTHKTSFRSKVPSGFSINISLQKKSFDFTISSSSGGVLTIGGNTISFPSNAFVTSGNLVYTGSVSIAINSISTQDPDFGFNVPGNDQLAIDKNGNQCVLNNFGILGVELQDPAGNPLFLAPGKKATITISINPAQLSNAPATIPIWHFEETAGLWEEEGTATKQTNSYVGEVSHFSWWSYSTSSSFAFIEGHIFDCSNQPSAFANINTVSGLSTHSDQNGYYYALVPINTQISLFASNGFDSSAVYLFNTASQGSLTTLPDFIIPCSNSGYISGVANGCGSIPVNGIITFFNPLAFTTCYLKITNGVFSGPVGAGPNINYMASCPQGSASGNINISPSPVQTTLGPLQLCNMTGTSLITCSFNLPSAGPFSISQNDISNSWELISQNLLFVNTNSNYLAYDTLVEFEGSFPPSTGQYTNTPPHTFNFHISLPPPYFYDFFPSGGVLNVSHIDTLNNSFEFSYSGLADIYDIDGSIGSHPVNFNFKINH
ncbi:MAG: carboxypeptidase-like regulatory domain-containing protein [Bacteroidia bacterium]